MDGSEVRPGRYMRTYTGKKFYPGDLRVEDICIEDIIQGLSGEFRFGGQSPNRITVAQHSVWVAEKLPDNLKLAGLLHDASEAYLKDIPSPVKDLLPDYKRLEHDLMCVIGSAFGLEGEFWHHPLVKQADADVLQYELSLGWCSKGLFRTYVGPTDFVQGGGYSFAALYRKLKSSGYANPRGV